ncbi:MAG: selenobiotic family peptide radical SAM maturase [Desulfobacca sp.]|nr:selenobiotic family peptide radical SAM maturase [Desulfobacca sp.]
MPSFPINQIFTRTRSYLKPDDWDRFEFQAQAVKDLKDFSPFLEGFTFRDEGPGFLPDLTRLEWAAFLAEQPVMEPASDSDDFIVNPSLQILPLSFTNLSSLFFQPPEKMEPTPGEALVLVWRVLKTGEIRMRSAQDADLLSLKIILEGISPEAAAGAGQSSPAFIRSILSRAATEGILIAPRTRIRRDPGQFTGSRISDPDFFEATFFTLQWHVTQACDLHCKHCYDRSQRSPLTLEQGFTILEDFHRFCRGKKVQGQISFSGGNPLLYPHFNELYRSAAERGFGTAILGNPTSRDHLETIRAIQEPSFFQVSLEGLEEHNDWIRGEGHFKRTIDFLEVLQNLKIYSMVMLTLTKDNLSQVIPLADLLQGKADSFFFNRLSQVGEGAKLQVPRREEYIAFLKSYLEAASTNPVMGLKDNLTNIFHYQQGIPVFGGCTGYGCGAAFNFLTLLPDGEVHACRKLPSRIGNVKENSLLEIYDSEAARRYRGGTDACGACPIRPVCGGCLAVAYGMGLNVFKDRDPYCFY